MSLPVNKIICGDCLEVMKGRPDNSVDSIVTDPPYEFGFMGKKWDSAGIAYNVRMWKEALRVLKPGGHILSFGGTRTYHRMACAIEDAGFEIRDQLQWLYGQGFPKSLNIAFQFEKSLCERKDSEWYYKDTGKKMRGEPPFRHPQANKFAGWGTALKPAHEPICLARKPLSEKTIARNVLKWGTGGMNIDGCRIGTEIVGARSSNVDGIAKRNLAFGMKEFEGNPSKGRFPANVILDEEAGRMLDLQSGVNGSKKRVKLNRKRKGFKLSGSENNKQEANAPDSYGDSGGASRFFYCPKASKKERNMGCEGLEERENKTYGEFQGTANHSPKLKAIKNNHHPTVKPLKLMSYLVRLITPPKGVVLDAFMGSGTTGMACKQDGFRFIGIEQNPEYCEIAKKRIEAVETGVPVAEQKAGQKGLFEKH